MTEAADEILHPPPEGLRAAGSHLFPELTRDDIFHLETPRLWLRWQRHADAAALESFAGRADVAEMTGTWPHPLPAGECERRIFEARKGNATGDRLVLGVTLKRRPAQLIGVIGVGPSPELAPSAGALALGYMLHPEHWGRGLMVEAVQAVVSTAFTYTVVEQIRADVRTINAASLRVLEKCGFRHMGPAIRNMPARGGMLPVEQFDLDRKTWAALSRWGQGPTAQS